MNMFLQKKKNFKKFYNVGRQYMRQTLLQIVANDNIC